MKKKIKELRSMLPIPLLEAKQLLETNDGDIETCVYLYTAKAIKEICDATGCSTQKANDYYRSENFDINRAISFIQDEIYDKSYQPIDGVNKSSLQYVKDWIYVMETKDFGVSLTYKHLSKVIDTLLLMPNLDKIAQQLKTVKIVYDDIFKDYNNDLPLDEFVRLNVKLDNTLEFKETNYLIPLQVLYIKNEVSKHWRNV